MKFIRIFLLFLLLILPLFGAGMFFEREKFTPYYQIAELFQRNITKVQKKIGLKIFREQAPKTKNIAFEIENRKIPSGLLPLKMTGFQLNAKHPIASTGGAISIVKNAVLIADRLENFFIYRPHNKSFRSAKYPAIPSNREAFYAWGTYGESSLFRLHDIEYAEIDGKGYVIASHESFDIELKQTRMAVHRLQIDPTSLFSIGKWHLLFETTPLPTRGDYFANGGGGRIVTKGNSAYLTIGDYNQDGVFVALQPPYPAQDKSSYFGSIIKLDILTGAHQKVSYGHRNPQGITISAQGEIFSTEHGPRGGDELNIIQLGLNYGWPTVSLGTDYPTYSWNVNMQQGRHDGFEAPIHAWIPSIGVSNLIEVNAFQERWNGDLLVASLKAASLFRMRRIGKNIQYIEPIWIGQRIRDLAQMPDGMIVLWTDQTQLLFITVDQSQLMDNKFRGIKSVSTKLKKCLKCHHLGPTNPTHLAPSLSNLIGRSVASDINYKKYSEGLKKIGGSWSRKSLTQFLMDPSGYAPGTSMAIEPITDLRRIRKLIDELEWAK
jgi:cytochrome c2